MDKHLPESTGPSRIRELNRRAILRSLREHGASARSDIIQRLGLSPAGVSSIVEELMADGLIVEGKALAPQNGRRGRPVIPLALNPNAVYTLGLTLRPLHDQLEVEGAWCNYAGDVVVSYSRVVASVTNYSATLASVRLALDALYQSIPDPQRIVAVGIGIPGVANKGNISFAPNLPFLEGERFVNELSAQLSIPVLIQNDVNLAVISALNIDPELSALRFAYLYISSGVGAGIASNNQLRSGTGWMGEIGHIQIPVTDDGFQSLEMLLGIDGYLSVELIKLGLDSDDLDGLAALCAKDDADALGITTRYAGYLYLAIQILNGVADLDVVVVDFPSLKLYPFIERRVNELIEQSALKTRLKTPVAKQQSSVRGAALNALIAGLAMIESREFSRPAA